MPPPCFALLVNRPLRKLGWKVIRIWECDLKPKNWGRIAARVRRALEARRGTSAR